MKREPMQTRRSWPVYEWDVVNEANGNNRIQGLIGDDQMAEWFKLAASNSVLPNCGLALNEYNLISARPESENATSYINSRTMMMTNMMMTKIAKKTMMTSMKKKGEARLL